MTTMKVARGLSRQANRATYRQAELSKSRSEFDKKPTNDVWRELQRLPEDSPRRCAIRNYFMERLLPLVRYNAERIHTRLPDEVDIEDLMSAGVFGLMDAIDAFDLERKVKFETYCPRVSAARSWTNCVRWTGSRAWSATARPSSSRPASRSRCPPA